MTFEATVAKSLFAPRNFPSAVELPRIKSFDIQTAKVGTPRVKDAHELWGLFWAQEESFARHSARSAERVQNIGKALIGQKFAGVEITPELVNKAATAMLVHDIGKLGVDVQGERAFSPDERKAMDVHTNIGADILYKMGFPDYMVLAAKWHHNVNTPEFRKAVLEQETVAIIVLVTAIDIKDAMTDTSREYIRAKMEGKTAEKIDAEVQDELRSKLGGYYTDNSALQRALRDHWNPNLGLSAA